MSASRLTVVLALSVSFAELASAGLWPETLAVLRMLDTVEAGLIWARILTVVEAPAASGPTARLPAQALLLARVASQPVPVQYLAYWSSVESVSSRLTAVLLD